jgi:putative nucleotidyltransferase with HDIG domain
MAKVLKSNELEKAKIVFEQLAAVKRKMLLYPAQHPELLDGLKRLADSLNAILVEVGDITFAMHDDDLFIESELLIRESITYQQFIRECESMDIGAITFRAGIDDKEVESLVDALCTDRQTLENEGGIEGRLRSRGVSHVVISSSSAESSTTVEEGEEETKAAKEVYNSAVTAVKDIMRSAKVGQSVNVAKVEKLVGSLTDALFTDHLNMLGLTVIKSYDETTFYHSVNTCILCLSLGNNLSLDRDKLGILGAAALLHDIGKVNIPKELTTKPLPLTSEEFEIMKRHPIEGAEILSQMPGMHKLSMVVAYEHHVGYDLSGYPKLTNKDRPHLFSRIVQVADSYEAGTSIRPFKGSKLPDQVLAEMIRQSGRAFDPVIMKSFVHTLSIYPVGSVVLLDTGEIAVVFESNSEDLARPMVKIAVDEDGKSLDPGSTEVVALSDTDKKDGPYTRSIIRVIDPWELGIDVVQFF